MGDRQNGAVGEHGVFVVDAALLAAARDLADIASRPVLQSALDRRLSRLLRGFRAPSLDTPDTLRESIATSLRDLLGSLPEVRMSSAQIALWRELSAAGVHVEVVRDECLSLYDDAVRMLAAANAERPAAFATLRRVLEFRFERVGASLTEAQFAGAGPTSRNGAASLLDRSQMLHVIRELASHSGSKLHAVLTLELRAAEYSQERFAADAADAADAVVADAVSQVLPGLRDDDLVGRAGLTELAFVLPGLRNAGQAALAANRIAQILETSGSAVLRGLRPTMGIALLPEHGTDPETLLRVAGIAQAEARARGERYLVYTPELATHSAVTQQLQSAQLQSEFRTALQENELSLALQAQYDFAAAAIVGSEALLRWESRDRRSVSSDVAVELAERTGLASSLSAWVLNNALRLSSELLRQGIDIAVSVNVGAADLLDPELPDLVDQGLRTWGIRPRRLTLEITENAMVRGIDRVLATLARLKEVGIELSIDDFGTGYSSLAYLGRLPVDELKIDKTFVRNMRRGHQDARMIGAIVDLARNFDLRVVAEGVEDERTFEALRLLGCHRIQGYYVAQPMAIDDFRGWMAVSRGRS